VYEYADAEGKDADAEGKKFVINSQNCIHVSRVRDESRREEADQQCKTCSIKVPTQDITWTGELKDTSMLRGSLMSVS
jgi:electron-transferring-flavoprotein dehydrogenase